MLVYRTRAKAVSSKPIFNAGTERFMRDWRSGIVTVTVRDQRNREHDPILGVVPLRLTDILATSSQVTRWYPLDGGQGFGRVRISVLFRSIETRLPPNMLGWDVGTFEFLSDRILAIGWKHNTKIKLRTGGSTGRIGRTHCHTLAEKDGVYFDVNASEGKQVRMPVQHRYRSPIIFEFHLAGKRGAAAYASIWLQHLTDNEETPIDIPIWTTANGDKLVQNYVTERNCTAILGLEDLKEVGRLQFRARFKAGTDESHREFVVDNNTRETFETWEACMTEGVRERVVEPEVPDTIQELHEKSLTEGRDILKSKDESEKRKWTAKTGDDWSGAFGNDPRAYTNKNREMTAEPGRDQPSHDPVNPSDDDDDDDHVNGVNGDDSDSEPDLGIHDHDHAGNGGFSPRKSQDARSYGRRSMDTTRTSRTNMTADTSYTTMTEDDSVLDPQRRDDKYLDKSQKRAEERKGRGMMQWKPARNLKFARDEGRFGLNKIKKKLTGGLGGREPGVETEVGS